MISYKDLKIGDKIACFENRHVRKINERLGIKIYDNNETLPFLTVGKEYEIVDIIPKKRKVKIIDDFEEERLVTFDRMDISPT